MTALKQYQLEKNPRHQGFTMVEFMVIIVIVLILVAFALPNFLSAQDNAREILVRANMSKAQIAAETYANDSGGIFPKSSTDPGYRCCFPGGNGDETNPIGGDYPVNPFSNKREAILLGNINDIQGVRDNPPQSGLGQPGQIFYSPLKPDENGNPTDYAIMGADRNGAALMGNKPNTTLVLSH